jgi:hypothetical protein
MTLVEDDILKIYVKSMQPTIKNILTLLQQVNFPPDKRRSVRAHAKDPKRGFVLGYVVKYDEGWTASRYTQRQPDLAKLLCDYAKEKIPHFKFSSIMVNEGGSALHIDSKNVGPSYIMSVGHHTGGNLWQYPGKELRIKNRLVMCDGLLPHMTLAFEGERFSIVYFNMYGDYKNPSQANYNFLKKLGFHKPKRTERQDSPRPDLLPEAASLLRRRGVSSKDIGDYLNKRIPSEVMSSRKSRGSGEKKKKKWIGN